MLTNKYIGRDSLKMSTWETIIATCENNPYEFLIEPCLVLERIIWHIDLTINGLYRLLRMKRP